MLFQCLKIKVCKNVYIQGKTSIPHDSENSTNVGHCAKPGCYSKSINYSASIRQMEVLAELSNSECHQSIRVSL